MSLEDAVGRFSSLQIVQGALSRLMKELSPTLVYHSYEHTVDVLTEALRFALCDGLSERDQELLAVAAAYHDLGFIDRKSDNEELGSEYAAAAMSRAGGYTPEEIDAVRTAILDTKVKMTPEGPRQVSSSTLSNYLLDADVSNLGRDDFFEKADLVRRELGVEDVEVFLLGVAMFLKAQSWYSPAGQHLRGAGKQKNIQLLAERTPSVTVSKKE